MLRNQVSANSANNIWRTESLNNQSRTLLKRVTYQLADGSANRFFNELILAYFWNIIDWRGVIRLRYNPSDERKSNTRNVNSFNNTFG